MSAFCGVPQGAKCAKQSDQSQTGNGIVEKWCVVERWRAMRKNPTLVIGQRKGRLEFRAPIRTGAHVIVEPGFTHFTLNAKKLYLLGPSSIF